MQMKRGDLWEQGVLSDPIMEDTKQGQQTQRSLTLADQGGGLQCSLRFS